MRSAAWRWTCGWLVGVLLAHGATGEATSPEKAWPALRAETFEAVWSTVDEAFYDPTFGGVDWAAVRERYRPRVLEAGDNASLRTVLQAMLGELRQSHLGIVPREAAVFEVTERTRRGSVGLQVEMVEGETTITAVAENSSAERAGLRRGQRIGRVGELRPGASIAALRDLGWKPSDIERYVAGAVSARLRVPVGERLQVEAMNGDGAPVQVELEAAAEAGEWSEPIGHFPSVPVECETRAAEDGIAYLRLSAFAPTAMKPLRGFLRGLAPTDGLIIDLRGNGGGVMAMAAGIAGWLLKEEARIGTMRLRRGNVVENAYPQEGAFPGPLAILIDGASASTSEVLAAALRDLGRARLFGQRSAGAALPSAFKRLPSGDLLQYPIGNLHTPKGTSLEGAGVTPDEVVERSAADVASGRDRVREAAERWLRERRQTDAPVERGTR